MSQQEPVASIGDDNALVTVDLSGDPGPETGGQKFGRILGGLLLMILGGVLTLACGAAWIASFFVPALTDWVDLLGDGLLFIGALFLGLAILGFELMRRGRRARNLSYADALAQIPGVDAETIESGPVLPPGASAAPPTSKPIL